MKVFLILHFLVFFFFASGQGENAFVYGKVVDDESNETLIGASIVYGNQQGTISDALGNYRLHLGPGKWKISCTYVGYQPVNKWINISSSDSVLLDFRLAPNVNEIDHVVVSASKVEQKLSSLTVSLTLIKPYFLNNNHISDPMELINRTPGIEVLDGQASIRGGSGFSYGAGSRVMALIDGLPVISPDAGNIRWQFLPLENLRQVEIIKGASSVMYGSSALNGIINFRTEEATQESRTRYFVETGFYGNPSRPEWKWWDTPRIYSNASLSHIRKFGNTDFGAGASVVLDKGYRKLNDEKLMRYNMRLKHTSKNVDGLAFGVNLNSGITEKDGFVLWENASTGALKQSETTSSNLIGTFLTLDPFVSFRQNDRTNHDLRMRIQSTQNNYPDNASTNSDALSAYTEYQGQHGFTSSLLLNFGLSENYSVVRSNFYGDHNTLNVAGYSQLDVETTKRLKLVAGLRIEQNIQDGNPDKLVPIFRAGMNYQLTDYSFLRGSFGQGYRYPSIAEKYASTRLGAVKIYPNPYVLPESGWNSEIGFKQGLSFGNVNGMVDLAAFYSQNRDMIEYVFGLYQDQNTDLFDVGFQAVNIEQSRVYGTELEFHLNHSASGLNHSLSGGYLFLYPVEYNRFTKKSTGDFLKYRRKHAATLNWNIRIQKFDVGINFIAKSKMLDIDDVFVNEFTREDILPGFYDYWVDHNKGYLLTNLSGAYRINDQLKASLVVKNILNIEYMGRPGDIMPQRNFSLRISGSF